MNQNSKKRNFIFVILFLLLLVAIKLVWLWMEYRYLPIQGIDKHQTGAKKSLYYRYRLASDAELPTITAPTSHRKPEKNIPSMKNLKLVGIYSSGDNSIVAILNGSKSQVLSIDESIDGFVLKSTSAKEAYFTKADKEYILRLYESKGKNKSSIVPVEEKKNQVSSENNKNAKIEKKDGLRAVPRSMLIDYTRDIQKAMRDIGLRPVRKNGGMQGYKVRFIRKNSPFSKLGLERGDVIKAINGEDIVDLAGPMSVLKNAGSIEGLTLTVVRGTEEKELEYEIK